MAKIFISYRRDDSPYVAGQIQDKILERFGSESAIFDVDSVPLGIDFRQYLEDEVAKCDILIAVIGRDWVRILNERLDDPKDFVRIEVEAALNRNVPVVPVLVDNASIPKEEELPTKLGALAYRNGIDVRPGRDVRGDLERLVDGLGQHLNPDPTDGTRQGEGSSRGEKHREAHAEGGAHRRAVAATREVEAPEPPAGETLIERLAPLLKNPVIVIGGLASIILIVYFFNNGSDAPTTEPPPEAGIPAVVVGTDTAVPEGTTLTNGGLMWTLQDNGEDVTWEEARAYCEDLVLAGYTDWSLASIDDLAALYDPDVSYFPRDSTLSVHINPLIQLTNTRVWSADEDGSGSAWIQGFSNGNRLSGFSSGIFGNTRALCVRVPDE